MLRNLITSSSLTTIKMFNIFILLNNVHIFSSHLTQNNVSITMTTRLYRLENYFSSDK